MNDKAHALGMKSTHFADPAGLSNETVSTARDLLRLVNAADSEALIRSDTTHPQEVVRIRRQPMMFVNSNRMVRNSHDWNIELQKTGFTDAAGRCLVMRATTLNRRLSMVFLNSFGKLTRFADAARVRKQLVLEASRRSRHPTEAAAILTKASS
jgi:D-alanyl-D-alanine endopeptidase (penicillin-binding protein 7)